MNRYRIMTLAAACVAVLAGVAYRMWGKASLSVVLPTMSLAFWAIALILYRESRAAKLRGVIALLPSLMAILVAVFATVGMVVYFVG
jgi:uncharacterized membrane protein YoaK (UPF0700 family)